MVLEEVCRGGPADERVIGKGWAPARSADGRLLAWYWSPGC